MPWIGLCSKLRELIWAQQSAPRSHRRAGLCQETLGAKTPVGAEPWRESLGLDTPLKLGVGTEPSVCHLQVGKGFGKVVFGWWDKEENDI